MLYYFYKTWCKPRKDSFQRRLTIGASNLTGKGKYFIAITIGSRDGFVGGGLLCFESKTNSSDYYNEMNGEHFLNWFKNISPLLNDNAV